MFIEYNRATKEVNRVHFEPENLSPEELSVGIVMDIVYPKEPPSESGRGHVLKFEDTTNVLYWETINRQLTDQEKILVLEQKIEDLNQAMAYMMGGGV